MGLTLRGRRLAPVPITTTLSALNSGTLRYAHTSTSVSLEQMYTVTPSTHKYVGISGTNVYSDT